uniref:SprT-like domain-containing protein n=1 Tax=Corethron hystrix TaxID=216773 RepID=A0A7S1BDD0_9STRA
MDTSGNGDNENVKRDEKLIDINNSVVSDLNEETSESYDTEEESDEDYDLDEDTEENESVEESEDDLELNTLPFKRNVPLGGSIFDEEYSTGEKVEEMEDCSRGVEKKNPNHKENMLSTEESMDTSGNGDNENVKRDEKLIDISNSVVSETSYNASDDESVKIVTSPPNVKDKCTNSASSQLKPGGSKMSKSTKKRSSFKAKKDILTQTYFNEFNRKVFHSALSEVKVEWSTRLQTTAGITKLRRMCKTTTTKSGDKHLKSVEEIERTASIELSTKVLDNEDRLKETLLHEMCHAAQWLIDGVSKPPHGDSFKRWAKRSMSVTNVRVTTTHQYEITYKYAWGCTTCKTVIKRQSRSIDTTRQVCGKCRGNLIEIEVPSSDLSNDFVPKKRKEASGFSLFVKENSKIVRKRLADENPCSKIAQKDVMKECGRLWAEQKRAHPSSVIKERKTSKGVNSLANVCEKLQGINFED